MTGVQQGTTFDCSNYGISGGNFDYFFYVEDGSPQGGLENTTFQFIAWSFNHHATPISTLHAISLS